MVYPEDKSYVESNIRDCLQGKVVSDLEFRVLRGDHQLWLRMNPYLYQEGDNTMIVGHGEDITVYKEQNEVLNKHNSKKKFNSEYSVT